MNKTFATWVSTKTWCEQNPGKTAAIVTPDGTFTIVYTPKSTEPLKGQER